MKKKIINVPTASAVFLRMRLIITSAAIATFASPLKFGGSKGIMLCFNVHHIELALPDVTTT